MLEQRPRRRSASPDAPVAAAPADGLREIPREEWNELVPAGQGPLRHGYLSAWEHAELEGFASRPLVVRRPGTGEPVAAAPAYVYDLDLATVHTPVLARIVSGLRRVFPRLLVARVYELGCPAARSEPLLFAPSVEPRAAAEALLRAALDEADRLGARMVIVQDFLSTDGTNGEALRSLGFSPVPIPQTVVVDLPFSSFDEYLAAMRSHYRRRARRVLDKSKHLQVEHVHDFGSLAPELARLWRLVFERADEVKRECLPLEYFRDTAELDEVSALVLWRPDGSIASYALLYDDKPWLHFLYTGFEEEAAQQDAAYFRLVYEILRHAIENGFEHVNLGITTLQPKLDAGGRPVPLCGWLRHRSPLLQRIFARVARGMFAPPPVAPRNVFKDDDEAANAA